MNSVLLTVISAIAIPILTVSLSTAVQWQQGQGSLAFQEFAQAQTILADAEAPEQLKEWAKSRVARYMSESGETVDDLDLEALRFLALLSANGDLRRLYCFSPEEGEIDAESKILLATGSFKYAGDGSIAELSKLSKPDLMRAAVERETAFKQIRTRAIANLAKLSLRCKGVSGEPNIEPRSTE